MSTASVAPEEIGRMFRYTEKAKALGVNVQNPTEARMLIECIRYLDARMTSKTDAEAAGKLGITPEKVSIYRSRPIMAIATQIVLEDFLEQEATSDIRHQLMSIQQQMWPQIMHNITRLAAGLPSDHARRLPTGEVDPRDFPPPRDQVTAFRALSESPVGKAYLAMIYLGEQPAGSELDHLEVQDKLLERAQPIHLDPSVIDGEVVHVELSEPDKE